MHPRPLTHAVAGCAVRTGRSYLRHHPAILGIIAPIAADSLMSVATARAAAEPRKPRPAVRRPDSRTLPPTVR